MSKKKSPKHETSVTTILKDLQWIRDEKSDTIFHMLADFASATGYLLQESGELDSCEIRWFTKRGECVRFSTHFKR